MSKLKIAQVTSMHHWSDDRIYQRTCLGLKDAGHEVTLIASFDKSFDNSIDRIPIVHRKGLWRRLISSFQATSKAFSNGFDIIHFHDPDLLPWMMIYSLFSSKKVVYDIHENYISRLVGLPTPLNKIASYCYKHFERICCRIFGGVVVVSNSMADDYCFLDGSKILVLPNYPYLKQLNGKLSLKPETPKYKDITIIISGSNSPERNCLQVVEALPKVLQKYPGVRLMFVGRYQPAGYQEALRSRAQQLGVSDQVVIEGMLPWLDNFERIKKGHIGGVFYADNLNNRVGIPNRIFEYMYSGLAVIGENFPEVEKVVYDSGSGCVVNSSDPDSIAHGLIELIANPSGLVEKGAKAKRAVQEKYNFDCCIPELTAFYRKLAN